jgi:hypothetical protein
MAQMPIRLYACSSRRLITIHDGGLYHGEELLGDLHLTPGRDKASWSAHVQTSTRTPAARLVRFAVGMGPRPPVDTRHIHRPSSDPPMGWTFGLDLIDRNYPENSELPFPSIT